MQFPSRGTKLYQLIVQNRETKLRQNQEEKKERLGMSEKIGCRWVSGLYAISMEFMEYEILIETPSLDGAAVATREDGISIFYKGIDVTDQFVDMKTTGSYIYPSARNLSKMMALVLQKEEEDNKI